MIEVITWGRFAREDHKVARVHGTVEVSGDIQDQVTYGHDMKTGRAEMVFGHPPVPANLGVMVDIGIQTEQMENAGKRVTPVLMSIIIVICGIHNSKHNK